MQAINPRKDVPLSIVVAMGVCTTLYVLMCMAITLAKPYYLIDSHAPFSVLFKTIPGWHWASYLVAVGAVIGVGTVVLVGSLFDFVLHPPLCWPKRCRSQQRERLLGQKFKAAQLESQYISTSQGKCLWGQCRRMSGDVTFSYSGRMLGL